MAINERLMYPSYEIIGGEKVMAPAVNLNHSEIIARIHFCFASYFVKHKNGYAYTDNINVRFSDTDMFIPDLSVVMKDREQILAGRKKIIGAPDMVVEVLSKSTQKKDRTVKKDTYEAYGVREYWIVDPFSKSVSVYLLRDGKYFLDDEYILFDEDDLEFMTDEEKADIKHEVPVSICEGLTIPLEFVFSWGY